MLVFTDKLLEPEKWLHFGSFSGELLEPLKNQSDHLARYEFYFSNQRSLIVSIFQASSEYYYSIEEGYGLPIDWNNYILRNRNIFEAVPAAGPVLRSEEVNIDAFFQEVLERVNALPALTDLSTAMVSAAAEQEVLPSLELHKIGVSWSSLNAQLLPYLSFGADQQGADLNLPFHSRNSMMKAEVEKMGTLHRALKSYCIGIQSTDPLISAKRFLEISRSPQVNLDSEQLRSIVNYLVLPLGFVRKLAGLIQPQP